jgi:hypothetical protein
MMQAATAQIVSMFETLGMGVEDIAEQQGMDPIAVKAALLQGSRAYRESQVSNSKDEECGVFTSREEQLARQAIVDLAAGSDDEHIRLKAAKYIRDDKKGRLDKAAVGKLNINVLVFNETLRKARAAKARALGDVIDLQPA